MQINGHVNPRTGTVQPLEFVIFTSRQSLGTFRVQRTSLILSVDDDGCCNDKEAQRAIRGHAVRGVEFYGVHPDMVRTGSPAL